MFPAARDSRRANRVRWDGSGAGGGREASGGDGEKPTIIANHYYLSKVPDLPVNRQPVSRQDRDRSAGRGDQARADDPVASRDTRAPCSAAIPERRRTRAGPAGRAARTDSVPGPPLPTRRRAVQVTASQFVLHQDAAPGRCPAAARGLDDRRILREARTGRHARLRHAMPRGPLRPGVGGFLVMQQGDPAAPAGAACGRRQTIRRDEHELASRDVFGHHALPVARPIPDGCVQAGISSGRPDDG